MAGAWGGWRTVNESVAPVLWTAGYQFSAFSLECSSMLVQCVDSDVEEKGFEFLVRSAWELRSVSFILMLVWFPFLSRSPNHLQHPDPACTTRGKRTNKVLHPEYAASWPDCELQSLLIAITSRYRSTNVADCGVIRAQVDQILPQNLFSLWKMAS